jgi:hypothetical protein
MSQIIIDGVIKDWGDRLSYGIVKGRKGKNLRGGGKTHAGQALKPAPTKATIDRTIKKTKEVMVKVSGGGKNMKHISAHMAYISRKGEIELEDENGDLHKGIEGVRQVGDDWAHTRIGIPDTGDRRKEAFNIVLSMPPDTDREGVRQAAKEFAKSEFEGYQYVFAAHEDERHPHVHLTVKAVGHDGVRLNPRKGDLQHWREQFAEKLREQGIEANATPRRARGIVQKAEKQQIAQVDKAYKAGKRSAPSRATEAQEKAVQSELKTGQTHQNPAEGKIKESRKQIETAYGQIARALVTGTDEDKKMAVKIVEFVKTLPPLKTQHQAMLDKRNGIELKAKAEKEKQAIEQIKAREVLRQKIFGDEKQQPDRER